MTRLPGNSRAIAGLLAGLGLLLGWLVFGLYRESPNPAIDEAGGPAAAVEPLPPEPSFSMPPIEDFAESLERPIFLATRRPRAGPAPEVAEPVPTALSFVLEGVVITSAERWALLRPQGGGDIIRLAEGGQVGGWQVIAIHPDKISLRRDEVETVLELIFKLAPPPVKKPPAKERRARKRARQ